MAIRLSFLVHGFLLLLALGCAGHRAISLDLVADSQIAEAKAFVTGVADNMPLWDADTLARYERVEIATVKADVEVARRAGAKLAFLADVARLHQDWDALVALDKLLKKESLT